MLGAKWVRLLLLTTYYRANQTKLVIMAIAISPRNGIIAALVLVVVYLLFTGYQLLASNERATRNVARSGSLEDFAGPPRRRYVLACSFWEKTTMAVTNMFSLLRFAHEWKAVVPVPFYINWRSSWSPYYTLGGFPNYTDKTTLSLKSLFKLDDFQSSPPKYPGLAQLVEYDHFLGEMRNASHPHTFLLKIYRYNKNSKKQKHVIRKVGCKNFNANKHIPDDLKTSITCCLVPSLVPTLPSSISKACGFDGLNEFLVIIEIWRGIAVPAANKKCRLQVPSSFVANYTFPIPSSLQQSDHVVECADKFVKEFVGEGVQFIGVHLRTEKLKLHSRSGLLNDTICLQRTFETVKELERNTNIKHTLYFADLSWQYKKKTFKAYGVKVTKFTPKKFGCLQNAAFVAQVEQTIVSRAARLVVCGGGSFQLAIMDRHRSSRIKKSTYHPPVIISGCSMNI